MIPALKFPSARRKSARACSSALRADSRSCRSACIENSLLRAMARVLTWSIWSRNCPFFTSSPSSTARWVIWPGMVAEMSTFFCAWILPLALTFACRSSRPTLAICTSAGWGPRLEYAKPPSTASSTTAIRIHRTLRFTKIASRRAAPDLHLGHAPYSTREGGGSYGGGSDRPAGQEAFTPWTRRSRPPPLTIRMGPIVTGIRGHRP